MKKDKKFRIKKENRVEKESNFKREKKKSGAEEKREKNVML